MSSARAAAPFPEAPPPVEPEPPTLTVALAVLFANAGSGVVAVTEAVAVLAPVPDAVTFTVRTVVSPAPMIGKTHVKADAGVPQTCAPAGASGTDPERRTFAAPPG